MKRLLLIIAIIFGTYTISSADNNIAPSSNEGRISSVTMQPILKSSTGHLIIHNPDDKTISFQIYSITGQVIKTVTASTGETIVDLPHGYYIVKCNEWAKQVIIR